MGIQGLQKIAALILLFLGFGMGWFFNSAFGAVSHVAAELTPQARSAASIGSAPQPIKIGNSTVFNN